MYIHIYVHIYIYRCMFLDKILSACCCFCYFKTRYAPSKHPPP